MGELLRPLPGAGLSAGCLPREAPGGTTAVAGPALEPWSQPPQELRSSPSAGPGGSGAGPLICSARGRSVLAVLGSPGLCLSQGEAGSWGVSRRSGLPVCAVGFVLPSAQPPWRSRHPSPSELLQVQPWSLQSFRELSHGVWCNLLGAQVSVSVPGSPRASPPSWRPASTPCRCLSTQEDW